MEPEKHLKTTRSISSPPGMPPLSTLATEGTKTISTSTCKLGTTELTSQKDHSMSLSPSGFGDSCSLKPSERSLHESTSVFSFGHDRNDDFPMTPRYSEVSTSTPSTSPRGDKMITDLNTSKAEKRETYKTQRKNYRKEKKRVAKELSTTLKDPAIIVLADWLKVRGTLKGWTKLWCVLKPGLLLLYKSPKIHKSSHWVGTVLLNACELIERPSKKDGFCFKLYHPLEQSIWASKGPKGEALGALVQPLPVTHLIFRAPSEAAGKCWMDALELALRCSSLLLRSMTTTRDSRPSSFIGMPSESSSQDHLPLWNESDPEKHFEDHDLGDDTHTDNDIRDHDDHEGTHSVHSSDSESEAPPVEEIEEEPVETSYLQNGIEEFGLAGDAGQTEEVADENKSLIWSLLKQVRPGMDLSKVVLPTFILEPRSFLDKLSDYYYHADVLAKAVLEDDPLTRMKLVTKFYLSGFYKKPKGLKKPYNPILGEMFRCYWKHQDTDSRTFYIAEQVSHHPPVSAFYVSNRQDGFTIRGSILAKSKFYGNSISAIMDGTAHLTLLTRGESYTITMPYAHCKGILMGTLTLELGGKVSICCEKTGYNTDIEFKLKPFLGGSELSNLVVGKIKLGKETLVNIEGHWDGEIFFRDKRSGEDQLFWKPDNEVRSSRLKRFTVPMEYQGDYESERLWQHVSCAIIKGDQIAATDEKTLLEEAQRKATREREVKCEMWLPRHFVQDIVTGDWVYKNADSRPWDPRTDVLQYERDFCIQTQMRHKAPAVRTGSIVSIDDTPKVDLMRHLSVDRVLPRSSQLSRPLRSSVASHGSESSSPGNEHVHGSDSTESDGEGRFCSGNIPPGGLEPPPPRSRRNAPRQNPVKSYHSTKCSISQVTVQQTLHQLRELQAESNHLLKSMQQNLECILGQQRRLQLQMAQRGDMTLFAILIIIQVVLHWLL